MQSLDEKSPHKWGMKRPELTWRALQVAFVALLRIDTFSKVHSWQHVGYI